MTEELKPCPFCGGEARLLLNAKRKIYGKDEYRTGVVACCNVCEARMFYGSEKLAIDAWNRRTGENNDVCQDCKAYVYCKNGVHVKCPRSFFDVDRGESE